MRGKEKRKDTSDDGTKITQRDKVDGEPVEQVREVPQHEVVARVPQRVAVHLHDAHRHDALNHFLADCRARHEDDPVKGAEYPVQASPGVVLWTG